MILEYRSESGKSRMLIRCPYCASEFWAYLWSLAGGGKRCENKECGAKHNKFGTAYPVKGREPK